MNDTALSSATAQRDGSLARALLISVAVLVALTAAAFWPEKPWSPPARPALQAPIVFDELLNQVPPPSSSANPSTSTESR